MPAILTDPLLLFVLGVLATVVVAWWAFRKGGGQKSMLTLTLVEAAHIDPEVVGVQFKIRLGGYEVSNLSVMELTVHNHGPNDVEVTAPERRDQEQYRPRVQLPRGYRVLTDPWNVERGTATAEVRVARAIREERQQLFIHVHRLAAGQSTTTRIVASTRQGKPAPLRPQDVEWSTGFLANCRVKGHGLLGDGSRRTVKVLEGATTPQEPQ